MSLSFKKRRLVIAAVIAAGLLVAGCGGGSAGRASAPSSPRTAFIKQADRVCRAANVRGVSAGLRFLRNSHVESAAMIIKAGLGPKEVRTVFIPTYQREIDELRALRPPKGDEAVVGQIFEGMQKLTDRARRRPQIWYQSSPFGNVYVPGTVSRRALEYGFEVCAASAFAEQPSRESVLNPTGRKTSLTAK